MRSFRSCQPVVLPVLPATSAFQTPAPFNEQPRCRSGSLQKSQYSDWRPLQNDPPSQFERRIQPPSSMFGPVQQRKASERFGNEDFKRLLRHSHAWTCEARTKMAQKSLDCTNVPLGMDIKGKKCIVAHLVKDSFLYDIQKTPLRIERTSRSSCQKSASSLFWSGNPTSHRPFWLPLWTRKWMNTMNPTKLDTLKVYTTLICRLRYVKGPYSTVGYHILYLCLQSGRQITISHRDKKCEFFLVLLVCERQKSWTVTAVTSKLSQKSHAYPLQRVPTLTDLGSFDSESYLNDE